MCGVPRLRHRSPTCAPRTDGVAAPIRRATERRHAVGSASPSRFHDPPKCGPRECPGQPRFPRRVSGHARCVCAPRSSALVSAGFLTCSSSDTLPRRDAFMEPLASNSNATLVQGHPRTDRSRPMLRFPAAPCCVIRGNSHCESLHATREAWDCGAPSRHE